MHNFRLRHANTSGLITLSWEFFDRHCICWLETGTYTVEKETAHLSLDHCPAPDLRGISCIVASIVGFILIGHNFGLLPATFASVFIAAIGDRTASLREAVLLALLMCALAVGLFHFVLHIQFPLFQLPVWKA